MELQQFEDHKTYIPGVGFLVTSWDGAESHIFPIEDLAAPKLPKSEAEIYDHEQCIDAQCARQDADLLHYEDNYDL